MMKKYEYLLFDADNTLFDFDKCERHAFDLAFEELGIKLAPCSYEIYHNINAGIWKELEKGLITREALKVERYRRLFEAVGITGDAYKDIAVLYEDHLANQQFELDGAFELLSELSESYAIFVVTNGLTKVQKNRFAVSRLTPFISKVYISEQMGVAKPDPKFFDKVLTDIGDADRTKYLVIGDSLSSDIDGAIASGIDCCWYDPTSALPDGRIITYIISELSEIKDILQEQR